VSIFSQDLELAMRLADSADAITLTRFRAMDLRVERKPDRTPVTDADVAVEDAIRRVLAAERPEDAVAGEERGGVVGAGRAWLVDPIDGTKNFLRGVPAWATLIALVAEGRPVVGMVSAPALGRRWWAAAGQGAWSTAEARPPAEAAGNTAEARSPAEAADATAGPRRLAVSGVSSLADAYVSTTDLGGWVEHHSREAYLALVDACWESRAFGDFWHHCLVAEGAIDLAVEPIVNPWDVAAIQIIVEEAGGRFTDLAGVTTYAGGSALSSNGTLHDAALAALKRPS
jgi:histidinol-phosphatase